MDIAELEKMIEAGRDSAMLRLTLSRLLAQAEQWDEAAGHLQTALTLDPDYTAAWKELGRVYHVLGKTDSALEAWNKGVEVARSKGDKQAEKEMNVFLKRLLKAQNQRQANGV